MPKPRKSAAEAERTGAWKKHPERRRTEPKPSGALGEPPAWLTEPERDAWNELVGEAHKDVLTAGDRTILALAAEMLADFKVNRVNWTAAQRAQLRYVLGELGLTPAARSKVTPGEKKPSENDPFEKFRLKAAK